MDSICKYSNHLQQSVDFP